ncbi:uncharacterized protein [Clytia hemisphaerica]|uniref:Cnidarian restricted protein n=1 Tax=Clytia hemisphaerica TaxID=252671 RepID=A0A7M6DNJ2_9CNID
MKPALFILLMVVIHWSLANLSIIEPSADTILTAERGQNVTFQWSLNLASNKNLSDMVLTTTPYISTDLIIKTDIWRQSINDLTNEGKGLFENRLTVSKPYFPNVRVVIKNANVKDSLKFKLSGTVAADNTTINFSSTITLDIKGDPYFLDDPFQPIYQEKYLSKPLYEVYIAGNHPPNLQYTFDGEAKKAKRGLQRSGLVYHYLYQIELPILTAKHCGEELSIIVTNSLKGDPFTGITPMLQAKTTIVLEDLPLSTTTLSWIYNGKGHNITWEKVKSGHCKIEYYVEMRNSTSSLKKGPTDDTSMFITEMDGEALQVIIETVYQSPTGIQRSKSPVFNNLTITKATADNNITTPTTLTTTGTTKPTAAMTTKTETTKLTLTPSLNMTTSPQSTVTKALITTEKPTTSSKLPSTQHTTAVSSTIAKGTSNTTEATRSTTFKVTTSVLHATKTPVAVTPFNNTIILKNVNDREKWLWFGGGSAAGIILVIVLILIIIWQHSKSKRRDHFEVGATINRTNPLHHHSIAFEDRIFGRSTVYPRQISPLHGLYEESNDRPVHGERDQPNYDYLELNEGALANTGESLESNGSNMQEDGQSVAAEGEDDGNQIKASEGEEDDSQSATTEGEDDGSQIEASEGDGGDSQSAATERGHGNQSSAVAEVEGEDKDKDNDGEGQSSARDFVSKDETQAETQQHKKKNAAQGRVSLP